MNILNFETLKVNIFSLINVSMIKHKWTTDQMTSSTMHAGEINHGGQQ